MIELNWCPNRNTYSSINTTNIRLQFWYFHYLFIYLLSSDSLLTSPRPCNNNLSKILTVPNCNIKVMKLVVSFYVQGRTSHSMILTHLYSKNNYFFHPSFFKGSFSHFACSLWEMFNGNTKRTFYTFVHFQFVYIKLTLHSELTNSIFPVRTFSSVSVSLPSSLLFSTLKYVCQCKSYAWKTITLGPVRSGSFTI